MARKRKWKMPKWMTLYAQQILTLDIAFIEELYNDDGKNSNVFNNAPRALQCVAVKSKVDLLLWLREQGRI